MRLDMEVLRIRQDMKVKAAWRGRMSDEARRTSGEIGTEGDAGREHAEIGRSTCRSRAGAHAAGERDIGRGRRRNDAAQVAVLAGMAGDETGFDRRFVARLRRRRCGR